MKNICILEEGSYGHDRGIVVAAGKSKTALIRWVRKNCPHFKRNRKDESNGGLFFSDDDSRTWLRHEPFTDKPEWAE